MATRPATVADGAAAKLAARHRGHMATRCFIRGQAATFATVAIALIARPSHRGRGVASALWPRIRRVGGLNEIRSRPAQPKGYLMLWTFGKGKSKFAYKPCG